MSNIGFKRTNQSKEPQVIIDKADVDVDKIIKLRGYQHAIKILEEYLSSSMPMLTPKEREIHFMNKFRNIKERYFERI